ALADPARHRDGSAERRRELLHDAEPETDAAGAPGARLTELAERVEDRSEVAFRDARSGVAHLDPYSPLVSESRGHRDAAVPGELDRVVDQVADDLLELHTVGFELR